jgi:hypothetical protein
VWLSDLRGARSAQSGAEVNSPGGHCSKKIVRRSTYSKMVEPSNSRRHATGLAHPHDQHLASVFVTPSMGHSHAIEECQTSCSPQNQSEF